MRFSLRKSLMRIVVVGGSAGAASALARLVASLPIDFPAPLIAAIRPGEGDRKLLEALVAKQSGLPVRYGVEGDVLESGHVYIAPEGAQPIIRKSGLLGLVMRHDLQTPGHAIDRLFISAAESFGSRVVGVVLSGSEEDGADGLKAIKKHGGRRIIQSPSDAPVPSMPMNALIHDSPNYVVLVDDLGPLIMNLIAWQPESDAGGPAAS